MSEYQSISKALVHITYYTCQNNSIKSTVVCILNVLLGLGNGSSGSLLGLLGAVVDVQSTSTTTLGLGDISSVSGLCVLDNCLHGLLDVLEVLIVTDGLC